MIKLVSFTAGANLIALTIVWLLSLTPVIRIGHPDDWVTFVLVVLWGIAAALWQAAVRNKSSAEKSLRFSTRLLGNSDMHADSASQKYMESISLSNQFLIAGIPAFLYLVSTFF